MTSIDPHLARSEGQAITGDGKKEQDQGRKPAVEVEIRLAGDLCFRTLLPADSVHLRSLLELLAEGGGQRAPRLLQIPLERGRAALTFAAHQLISVTATSPGRAPADEARSGSPAVVEPGAATGAPDEVDVDPATNVDEGHLGGYIRASPEPSPSGLDITHGDPWTWSPELWRWAVEKLGVRSVLDIGCGEGLAAAFFRDLGCEVLGIDGSLQAEAASRIPDRHIRHDYAEGPYVPDRSFDLVWSCEFVEHVEARFLHHFLASFAAGRRYLMMTHAVPGQGGWHHVNCQPEAYWVDLLGRLGFALDEDLTRQGRAVARRGRFAFNGLLFVRRPRLPEAVEGWTRDRRPAVAAVTAPVSAAVTPETAPATPDERPVEALPIHSMVVDRQDDEPIYLFFDLFVHPSRRKITAVVPHYGDDWQPAEHGTDLERVDLHIGARRIRGRYVPHRLDSWEPAILIDFEDPALAAELSSRQRVSFMIEAGPHQQGFELDTCPTPAYRVVLALVVGNGNGMTPHYLAYYLDGLGAEHVLVYDHGDAAASARLQAMLAPWARKGRVTWIPWPYRWRNRAPRKMVAQPAQQAHALNRFAHCTWIGFFDVDELLRLPGRSLPEFLAPYETAELDGLSFGLRWFFYRGAKTLDEIQDPPLEMLHRRRSRLGRKRQKLFIKPDRVRFCRLHWMQEGARELPVEDSEVFFHHYYTQSARFTAGKEEQGTYDDYMLRFADRLQLRPPSAGQTPDGRTSDPPAAEEGPAATRRPAAPRPATTEQWVDHIERAIRDAEAEKSRLEPGVLDIHGLCGVYNRHFLNNLCAFDDCRYLEIGSLVGASLCAAVAGHGIEAVAIENFSQFRGTREQLDANLARWSGESTVEVLEQDCFEIDTRNLGPFDVFYYDGGHAETSHYRALRRFARTLADPALVIIDDWNWPRVQRGTWSAIRDLELEVLYDREIVLPEEDVAGMPRHQGRLTWWNGVGVFLVGGPQRRRKILPVADGGRSGGAAVHEAPPPWQRRQPPKSGAAFQLFGDATGSLLRRWRRRPGAEFGTAASLAFASIAEAWSRGLERPASPHPGLPPFWRALHDRIETDPVLAWNLMGRYPRRHDSAGPLRDELWHPRTAADVEAWSLLSPYVEATLFPLIEAFSSGPARSEEPVLYLRLEEDPFARHPLYQVPRYDFYQSCLRLTRAKTWRIVIEGNDSVRGACERRAAASRLYLEDLRRYLDSLGVETELEADLPLFDRLALMIAAPHLFAATLDGAAFLIGLAKAPGRFFCARSPLCQDRPPWMHDQPPLAHDEVPDYHDVRAVLDRLRPSAGVQAHLDGVPRRRDSGDKKR